MKQTKLWKSIANLIEKIIKAQPVLFLIVALAEGLLFSVLVPYGQIPDEFTHYKEMEKFFGTSGYNQELYDVLEKEAGFGDIIRDVSAKVDRQKLAEISKVKFEKQFRLTEFRPRIYIVRYLPAGIGFYFGAAMKLPILYCTQLAEILSVIFYALMGYLVLKTAPVKKDIFMFCMLIPMVMQQCSSINYDVVLIPCCFLLFAYVLKLYYQEAKVGWKDIAILLVITAVIALVKIPYILLAGSVLIIPHDHYDLKLGKKFELAGFIYKFRYLVIALGICFAGLVVLVGKNNVDIKTIIADVLELPGFIRLMKSTYNVAGGNYMTGIVGLFGWHEFAVSAVYVTVFFVMLMYFNMHFEEGEERFITPVKRGWLILICLVIGILVFIAMQAWTYKISGFDRTLGVAAYRQYIYDIPVIEGVQGRYFIPFLPVVLYALSGKKKRESVGTYNVLFYGYLAVTFLMIARLMYVRFWV